MTSGELPRRIAISGASGLVGTALHAALSARGDTVVQLVRGHATGGPQEVAWDPAAGSIDRAGLEGLTAVVHLAGAGLADGRWTAAHKALIRSSRVDGTRLLAECLASLERPPAVLVMASAVGFYGDRGDEKLDEASAGGEGFLAEVVRDWEIAALPAESAGIRTVKLRMGVVLSRDGGALPKLLTPFKLGVGGRVGGGDQWMSWVAIDDVTRAFLHAIDDEELSGIANLVAPSPVQNRTLTKTLGRVLRRPTILPVPRWAVSATLGEMARETILASARVLPKRLEERGFSFAFPELEPALRHVLGRPG